MLKNIKTRIGKFLLRRQLKHLKREKEFFNFETAQTCAVVYDATGRLDYDRVKELTKYLKDRKIRVLSIGYIDKPELYNQFKTQLEYRFFAKKDLNWHFKPDCLEVRNFLEEEFDVLINLCQEDCLPIKYIAGLSLSKCKVGPSGTDSNLFYDLIIDVGDKRTIDNFISNVKQYIDMINK